MVIWCGDIDSSTFHALYASGSLDCNWSMLSSSHEKFIHNNSRPCSSQEEENYMAHCLLEFADEIDVRTRYR